MGAYEHTLYALKHNIHEVAKNKLGIAVNVYTIYCYFKIRLEGFPHKIAVWALSERGIL
jgi:hypothetical protein